MLQNVALLLCVYLLSLSVITSLIVSNRWQHVFTFVSAVDVSDSCTQRVKMFRNHTETEEVHYLESYVSVVLCRKDML
jgi:hypothetical protein